VTLPSSDQVLYRARDVLDWHVRVHSVLVEEIDPIGLEPLQRSLSDLADVGRSTVQTRLLPTFKLEPELRRNDDPIANGRHRFAHDLLVGKWPVRFGGIKERDASIDGGANDRDTVFATGRLSVTKADAHAAEAQRRYLQTVSSQYSRLHGVNLPAGCRA
jgi:hypothetical protein